MISLKLNEVVNIAQHMNTLMNQNFSGATAFKIARIVRELSKEVETFDKERAKLVEKYGERDENGQVILDANGTVKVIPSMTQDCNKEFDELMEQEVQINASKLPSEVIEEMGAISPNTMLALEPIFEIE